MLQFESCMELLKPISCLNSIWNDFVVRDDKTSSYRHTHGFSKFHKYKPLMKTKARILSKELKKSII